jgi:dihydroorotate dehydrogenase
MSFRSLVWKIAKKAVFLTDPEDAHTRVLRLLRLVGLVSPAFIKCVSGAGSFEDRDGVDVFGLRFASRVGLAAGFDKDAKVVDLLPSLGFGFAEIGTVTPRPQPGNPRPRLFRQVDKQALFNCMGFNGDGAVAVAGNLARLRPRLPNHFRVGVNIGKNKDTPLELAADDYAQAIKPFENLADFVVINVSSPNTPGLRSLQTYESLKRITDSVNEVLSRWTRRPPLLLKLAPEIRGEALSGLLNNLEGVGIDGWVLTNTLGGEWRLNESTRITGGWSGLPVTEAARASLIEARSFTRLPIVSVGGIMTPEEAAERIKLGASLVQIYSGWIYGGPSFPVEVARAVSVS